MAVMTIEGKTPRGMTRLEITMAIDSVSGNVYSSSLQGSEGASVTNNAEYLANLPSYLKASDLDFSAAATGVLGIRLPLSSAVTSDELLLALWEHETALRANRTIGLNNISDRIGNILLEAEASAAAAEIIQTAINTAEEQLEQAQEDLENAQDFLSQSQIRRDTLISDIASLAAQISALNAQIALLDSQIAGLDGNIQGIESEIAILQGKITQNSNAIAALESQQQGYASQISDLQAQEQAINDEMVSIEDRIAYLEAQPGDHSEEISALQSQYTALEIQKTGINSSITSLQGLYNAAGLEIQALQEQGNDLAGQLDTANSQRDQYISQRAIIDAQRQPLIADRTQKQAEKATLDAEIASVNSDIENTQNIIIALNNSIIQLEEDLDNLNEALGDVMGDRSLQNEQINEAYKKQQGEGLVVSSESHHNAERLLDVIKQMLRGVPLVFWNESNRERIMRTEVSRESQKPDEVTAGQFSAYAITRTLQGEVINNQSTLTSRELDKISANRAYEENQNIVSELANVMKAVEELFDQPSQERDVQHGKVMLSLT